MAAAGLCFKHVGRLVTVFVDPRVACHVARDVVRGIPVELCCKVVSHVAVCAFSRPELKLEPVSCQRKRNTRNVHDEEVTFLAGRTDQHRLRKLLGHLTGFLGNGDTIDNRREAAVGIAFAQDELLEQAVCLVDLIDGNVFEAA